MALSNLPAREEYQRKRRKRRLFKVGIVFFLLILVIGLLSYGAHRNEIRISSVGLIGGILVTESEVQYKTLEHLKGSYLWLFPKNNALLYAKGDLKKYLLESFKRIDSIDIHRDGFKTLVVTITERKPFAIWCTGLSPEMRPSGSVTDREGGNTEDSSPRCYFMDQNSTIFSEAPQFSGDAYFKYYGLVGGDDPIGKEYMASTTKFSEISDFVGRVKTFGIYPQYIMPKGDGDFSIVLLGGGQIYFDIKEPLTKVADNLEALLATPEFSKKGSLQVEYIDMRYGNKLFYKLKNQ